MYYEGMNEYEGKNIPEDEALDFALEELENDTELCQEFVDAFGDDIVEWFYSGNWIERDEEY